MAIRRRIGDVAQMLLQSHLIQQRQQEAAQAAAEERRAMSKQAYANELLKYFIGSPKSALRAKNAGGPVGDMAAPFAASQSDLVNEELKPVMSAKTPGDLPASDESFLQQIRLNDDIDSTPQATKTPGLPTGGKVPFYGASAQLPEPVRLAMEQEKAKRNQVMTEAGIPTTKVSRTLDNGGTQDEFVPTRNLGSMGPVQTGLSAGQQGLNAGTQKLAELQTPGLVKAEAGREGALAGAREAAQFPWQVKLAQIRADNSLQSKIDYDNWLQAHPKATAQEINKRNNATAALGTSQEIRAMVEELDKRGLIGPLAGRYDQLAAGTIKAEAMFKNPDDARLVADYISRTKLLSSLAAVTHGGARGGGSIQMVQQFNKILNSAGDKSIIFGQLDALDSLMTKYREHPDQVQPDLNIPGLTPSADSPEGILDLLRSRGRR